MKTHDIYTCIDLEMNADGERTYEIIQIGAVIGNVSTGEILDKLSLYISLPEGRSLYPYITTLTGITDNTIATKGMTLQSAYETLKAAHQKHGSHHMVIQWGGGDERGDDTELRKQLGFGKEDPRWIFGRRNWDVKTICQAIQQAKGGNLQGGLKKNCQRHGVQFEGPAHDALNDAQATFSLFCALLPKLREV